MKNYQVFTCPINSVSRRVRAGIVQALLDIDVDPPDNGPIGMSTICWGVVVLRLRSNPDTIHITSHPNLRNQVGVQSLRVRELPRSSAFALPYVFGSPLGPSWS